MRTIITNKIIVENYSMALLDYCEDNLVIPNPDFHIAQRMGRYTRNIPPTLTLYERNGWDLHIPFGELGKIWDIIKDSPYELKFAPFKALSLKGDITLYPYQENAIKALKNAKNGVLESPCGSGKTQMGIALIKELGQKALWLTHTKDLLTQSMQRAKDYFEGDFGTITDGKVNIGQDITFATVQTMTKLDLTQYQDEWNVVIVDECHRVAGTPTKVMQFYKVLSNLKARHKFGLSATLDRVDGLLKSTFSLLGDIVYKINQEEVGDKIIKAKHELVATDLLDSEEYLETDGTFNYMKLIDYIVHNDERNVLIASNIAKFPFSHHLVLSHRVAHLNVLKAKLDSIGIKCEMIYGSLSKDKREDIFNEMREGNINVLLATYQLAKEGLDIPILDTLHLATPNKNKSIVKQSAGRIERNIEDKETPIVYDYVDVSISYCLSMYKKRKAILK
jgi:superfamily II DNA or RNA helicase